MKNNLTIFKLMVMTLTLLCATSIYATAAETRLATIFADGGKAVLIFADSPLQTMTEIPFAIELHKNSGATITDASLALDLTMPAMPMPPNNPKAIWRENAYRGTAVFTMAGAWQVNVEVKRPDAETEKIIFDIEMVIMK